jgi:hypothetical protein
MLFGGDNSWKKYSSKQLFSCRPSKGRRSSALIGFDTRGPIKTLGEVMGYTHYWESEAPIAPDVWAAICADAKTLIAAFPPIIQDLKVDDNEISFNGACDSFVFLRLGGWECCKTRGEPYDKLVCAILAVAAQRYPGLAVGSDAQLQDDESLWIDAIDWASEVLGRNLPLPLRGEAVG